MNIKVNNINLYYEKIGCGTPLLLIHGNGESCRIFDKAVNLLKSHFTVYAIDMRGHGQSENVNEYHYNDMADDIFKFIEALNIIKPVYYGFSDGGITGLILASRHPLLLSKLIVSGVNLKPNGLKLICRISMLISYIFSRSKKTKMMLTEPDISKSELSKIQIPVLITAGNADLIKQSHTVYIRECIPGSVLKIFNGETHGSYIVNSEKIANYIIENK